MDAGMWLTVSVLLVTFTCVPAQKFQYSRGWMPGGKRADADQEFPLRTHFRQPPRAPVSGTGFAAVLAELLQRQEALGPQDIKMALRMHDE